MLTLRCINREQDNIYGAVIMAQSHCEGSPGSFDEYKTQRSAITNDLCNE